MNKLEQTPQAFLDPQKLQHWWLLVTVSIPTRKLRGELRARQTDLVSEDGKNKWLEKPWRMK